MELSLLALAVVNFAYVCLLPFIFFKGDGTWNVMWCLTALPYVVFPCLLIAGYLGQIETMFTVPGGIYTTCIVVLMMCFSIGLISMTVGGHRVPLSLWHQNNDAPASIVTYGAYKKVRHPFYTSFIICLTAGWIIFPHVATIAVAIYGYAILTATAMKEEKKLSASEFGEDYKAYMKTTGRFFPRVF